MADVMMNDGKKYIEKEYASKGTANTALGLSIGALGYEMLKNGGLNGLLGGIAGTPQTNPEQTPFFELYKGYRDADDAIVAKHNADAFALYKNNRDGYDVLKSQIDAINCKLAVADANIAWQNKTTMDAIALEAERRMCSDEKIVNYVNTTFVPKYVADLTPATGATQASIFNPLCGCCKC